jgi:UMF1 family MFS transporter
LRLGQFRRTHGDGGFFPIFFKQYWSQGTDVEPDTAQLGIGNSIAGLLMALLAPVLGAVADRASARKFLLAFAGLGSPIHRRPLLGRPGEWAFAICLCH